MNGVHGFNGPRHNPEAPTDDLDDRWAELPHEQAWWQPIIVIVLIVGTFLVLLALAPL